MRVFLQELGQKNEWVSELIFGSLFVSFMLWSFSPFVTAQKRFYTAVLFSRLLMVLVSEYTLFADRFVHWLYPAEQVSSLHQQCFAVMAVYSTSMLLNVVQDDAGLNHSS